MCLLPPSSRPAEPACKTDHAVQAGPGKQACSLGSGGRWSSDQRNVVVVRGAVGEIKIVQSAGAQAVRWRVANEPLNSSDWRRGASAAFLLGLKVPRSRLRGPQITTTGVARVVCKHNLFSTMHAARLPVAGKEWRLGCGNRRRVILHCGSGGSDVVIPERITMDPKVMTGKPRSGEPGFPSS